LSFSSAQSKAAVRASYISAPRQSQILASHKTIFLQREFEVGAKCNVSGLRGEILLGNLKELSQAKEP
jgi:hypothetical protein